MVTELELQSGGRAALRCLRAAWNLVQRAHRPHDQKPVGWKPGDGPSSLACELNQKECEHGVRDLIEALDDAERHFTSDVLSAWSITCEWAEAAGIRATSYHLLVLRLAQHVFEVVWSATDLKTWADYVMNRPAKLDPILVGTSWQKVLARVAEKTPLFDGDWLDDAIRREYQLATAEKEDTAHMRTILRALQNRAMSAEKLAKEVGFASKKHLYDSKSRGKTYVGPLAELTRSGRVRVDRAKGGYFRPDAPPKESGAD